MNSGTLDMSLLGDVKDYVDFVKTSDFIKLSPLVRLGLALLKPKIEPSNVWNVLHRLVCERHLAAVCDEVIFL